MPTQLNELIPALQVSVSPVILISGVGLLLLSLTNRFGRAVDRSRQLMREMRDAGESDRRRLAEQVHVLYQRAKLIQASIILSTLSVLFATLMIITLFFTALLKWESSMAISAFFICCVVSLIASLIAFLRDIHLSMHALRLEFNTSKPDTTV